MKNIKESMFTKISVFVLYFQHSLKFLFEGDMIATVIGNLDPVYSLAFFEWIKNRKRLFRYSRILTFLLFMLVYSVLQFIVLDNFDIIKAIVTYVKIVVCIFVMVFMINNINQINIRRICKYISYLYGVSLIPSFIFYMSNVFWTTNDIVNKYNLTRLRLLYYEPSELGYRIGIFTIILVGLFLVEQSKKEKSYLFLAVICNLLCLYFAKPMGTILIGSLSIAVMLANDLIFRPTKTKKIIYSITLVLFVLAIIYLVVTNSNLYLRFLDTLTGADSSTRYRVRLSFDILLDSIPRSQFLGIGLGNVNTVHFRSQYVDIGLVTVITNSFVYYILELGILGIGTFIMLLVTMFKSFLIDKSSIKIGLILFIIIYQFAGGYPTNPLNWVVYGIVLSNFSEYSLVGSV